MKLFKKFLAVMALVIPAVGVIPVQANPGAVTTVATQVTAKATNEGIKETVTNALKAIKNSEIGGLAYSTGSVIYYLGKSIGSLASGIYHEAAQTAPKVAEIFKIISSSNTLTAVTLIGGSYYAYLLYREYIETMRATRNVKITYNS